MVRKVNTQAEFRKRVLKALIDAEHSTTWLAEEVTRRTGLYCDTGYLSKMLRGTRQAKKIRAAVAEILGLNEPTIQ